MNIAVLCSTNGTDLQAIIDNQKNLAARLKIVICNKHCGAFERAQQHGIPALIVEQHETREEYDEELTAILKKEQIELIVLIGYMRILSPGFARAWKNKIMNIHPSLLPAFKGGMDKNVHQQVIDSGCKVTGCTLHFVTEDVDEGPIIMQKAVVVEENDTAETLKARVQQAEQDVILHVLRLYAEGRIIPNGKKVIIVGNVNNEGNDTIDQKQIIKTSAMNENELQAFLKKQAISLTINEVRLIEQKLNRDPTLTELYIFNIEWSEHCSYKSTKRLLKMLPTEGKEVILGPSEDAGIIELGTFDGEKYGIVFKQESHNHPSQVVPYEGAATGIGGCIRDVFCMGAQVLALADPLRFGNPEGENGQKVKYIANSVIDGIAGYGNPLGLPVIAGDVYFNESFNDNCLVNVVCIGLIKADEIIHSRVPRNAVGHDVIVIGKATDNSGFGGAAFASVTFGGEDSNRGAVQVPDPFLKNVLIRAITRVFEEARKGKIEIGFKDCGAGGIMCATAELGSESNLGMDIMLENVNVSMEIPSFVIACGETQERFVMVVPPEFTPTVLRICNEEFALPKMAEHARASIIGKVRSDDRYILRHNGTVVCNAPIMEITRGIQYTRTEADKKRLFEEPTIVCADYNKMTLDILHHPHVASKAKAYKHYDSEVLGNTVIRPGDADAGVIRPLHGQKVAVALSTDCNPMYCRIDPEHGAALAVAEAMRNVAAVGATPIALTDCINGGNPEKPEQFGDIVKNIKGLADAARNLWRKGTSDPVPFVSGNVSLYNESAHGAIDPSPIVACLGKIDDYSNVVTMKLKKVNSGIYLVGKRKDECGGSVYYQLHHEVGRNLPRIDFKKERDALYGVIDAISERLVLSCHDISDGGLVGCITEMMLGGDADGIIGVALELHDNLATDKLLFSETPGFMLEVADNEISRVKEIFGNYCVDFFRIGTTVEEARLTIKHSDKIVVDLSIDVLKNAWTTGFQEAL